jgi:hypothetical protein
LPLYESELDDHGSSRVTLKVIAAGPQYVSAGGSIGAASVSFAATRHCCPAHLHVGRSSGFLPALHLCLCAENCWHCWHCMCLPHRCASCRAAGMCCCASGCASIM